jgi:hypothetical protein
MNIDDNEDVEEEADIVLETEESDKDPDEVEELRVYSDMEWDQDAEREKVVYFPIHQQRKWRKCWTFQGGFV